MVIEGRPRTKDKLTACCAQANFFDMVSVMEAKAYAKAAQFDQAAREGQETLRQIDIISEDSGNQHRPSEHDCICDGCRCQSCSHRDPR